MFLLNCIYTIGIPVVWDTEHWLFLQLCKCKQHYQQQKMCRSPLIYVASKNSVSVKKKKKKKNVARSPQFFGSSIRRTRYYFGVALCKIS